MAFSLNSLPIIPGLMEKVPHLVRDYVTGCEQYIVTLGLRGPETGGANIPGCNSAFQCKCTSFIDTLTHKQSCHVQVVGFVWGYVCQQFEQTILIIGAGCTLAAIVSNNYYTSYYYDLCVACVDTMAILQV